MFESEFESESEFECGSGVQKAAIQVSFSSSESSAESSSESSSSLTGPSFIGLLKMCIIPSSQNANDEFNRIGGDSDGHS